MIRKDSSKALFALFLGSFFSFSAQIFLLTPHRQANLLADIEEPGFIALIFLFLLGYLLNFSLLFFQRFSRWARQIAFLSVFSLFILICFFASHSFWVGVILLSTLSAGSFLSYWQKEEKRTFIFHKTVIFANLVTGIFFLFAPQFFPAFSSSFVKLGRPTLGLIFIAGAGFGLFARFAWANRKPRWRQLLVQFTSLPWMIWIILSLISGSALSIVFLPALALVGTILTSGLLPFKHFQLPQEEVLGSLIFLVLIVFQAGWLFFAHYLLSQSSFAETVVYDAILLFSLITTLAFLYGVMSLHYVIYNFLLNPGGKSEKDFAERVFEKTTKQILSASQELPSLTEWQAIKIQRLSTRLLKEREEARHMNMLSRLRNDLDNQFDDPVAAQLTVNAAQKFFNAKIVVVSIYDIEKHELAVIASAGELQANILPGYRQNIDKGIMGRAAREKKTQVVGDTTQDKDYIAFSKGDILSEVEAPLLNHGHLKGMLTIGARKKDAFSALDLRTLEGIANELMKTWERSGYNRRLRIIIEASTTLSTSLKLKDAIEEIALIARDTLEARFVFVTLFDQDGSFTRTASCGYAPNLENSLTLDLMTNSLLKVALDAKKPFRIRDVRKYQHMPKITIDHSMLRGLIIIPIRLHGVSIGAILGFGKQGGIFFSEKDESLAGLLSTQASAAIESAWLIQEVRSASITSGVLKRLSLEILETEKIEDAARYIAKAARSLAKASVAGIVLFSLDRKIETALEVTDAGVIFRDTVPLDFIEQTLTTGELITHSSGASSVQIYLPIQTSLRKYGVLWMEFNEGERQASSQMPTLETLSNQAAVVLERSLFLREARQKTEELKEAFSQLQKTYDETLLALMSALDARDRETEGHSERVGKTACLMGEAFNLPKDELRALQLGSLLHDIGKIGISDTILKKSGKLTQVEWAIMRTHPEIGKRIIEDIPFLHDAVPVVHAHHERWNGSGYPQGLQGEEIPLSARIFAVADIFDALTSHRTYRKKISGEQAMIYLKEQAGILVDPQVVRIFEELFKAGKVETATTPRPL